MMKWLFIKWLCLTGAVLFAAYVVDGIYVSGFFSAFFTAAALGILNMFFRPVLFILTLPINIMTLGLFTFIINAMMLSLTSWLSGKFQLGFQVEGFRAAFWGALLISLASVVLSCLIPSDNK